MPRPLKRRKLANAAVNWACYHTEMWRFAWDGTEFGIIGCAVGARFAALLAEQMFASGCRFLISVTSAGQIAPVQEPPYFILIDRALRDERAITTCRHRVSPKPLRMCWRVTSSMAYRLAFTKGPPGRPMPRTARHKKP
jgi:hypothetical protein